MWATVVSDDQNATKMSDIGPPLLSVTCKGKTFGNLAVPPFPPAPVFALSGGMGWIESPANPGDGGGVARILTYTVSVCLSLPATSVAATEIGSSLGCNAVNTPCA